MITAKLGDLAELVQGRLVGDAEQQILGASTLTEAVAGQISFADHPKLRPQIDDSEASAVVVPESWEPTGRASIHVARVRWAFGQIVRHLRPPFERERCGVSPLASVHPSADLAEDVEVHPHAAIGPDVRIGRGTTVHANVTIRGRCRIGRDVKLFPGCVLYRDTVVGDRVVVHANAVLGAWGFGYDTIDGHHVCSDQLGFVVLEPDVEIGAGTTIDRGTYGPTVIGAGTKIDNQVMIAHNCRLGKHNLICSQVGVAGSSTTGDYVVMAGQVGVPDHIRVGHRVVLGAKSGIMRDVPDDSTLIGIPATPERDQMAKQAAFAKLPEMRRQLRQLMRDFEALKSRMPETGLNASQQHEAA